MKNAVFPISILEKDKFTGIKGLDLKPEVLAYVQSFLNHDYGETSVLKTTTRFNIDALSNEPVSSLVNIKPGNDLRQFNKFFETVNANLTTGGHYIGCFESKEQRKKRIFKKLPTPAALPFYTIDFIWNRIFPKISLTQKFYFSLTKGLNRVLSVPEVLGRLISCGFKIVDYTEINNMTYFTIQKISKPAFDNEPTYGPLITLNRVGKDGKWVKVYKIRTMHPFAEYLQKFVYDQNQLQDGGKFKDDFRITSWGKFLRKFWLDELPMLFNWLKGDLKLVGVRPLSQHYFKLYPKSFRERRRNYKPGLVPPFYVDLPDTLDEILASEKKYLMQYDKHPFLTDLKYFFKSFYNIIVKKARSK